MFEEETREGLAELSRRFESSAEAFTALLRSPAGRERLARLARLSVEQRSGLRREQERFEEEIRAERRAALTARRGGVAHRPEGPMNPATFAWRTMGR